MSQKNGRQRADAAHDLETLLGVVNDQSAAPARTGRRVRSTDHAIAVVLDRAGVRRKAGRRR